MTNFEENEMVQSLAIGEQFCVSDYETEVRLIEALLFASESPLKEKDFKERLPAGTPVKQLLEHLTGFYQARGVNVVNVAGGWAFRTALDLKDRLRIAVTVNRKLSLAALETMAIIAYHQPVTRGDIESIRGVAVSKGTLDTLLELGWIRPRGRRKVPGRPLQWGTSEKFLDHFGLGGLNDLPGLDELKATGLLERRENLTSLILPDDIGLDEDDAQDELFPQNVDHDLKEFDG